MAARGVGFHRPMMCLFKRLLCCCLHSFFGTYLGQVDGNPDLGENVALSILERFSYTVFISICLQINTLPAPLDFGFFSPFFSPFSLIFFFSFSFSSADVDLEEAGKEGGKSREVMRLNKEGKWSYWHFSVSMCGRDLHRIFDYIVNCSAGYRVTKACQKLSTPRCLLLRVNFFQSINTTGG